MVRVLEDNMDAIVAACRHHGVRRMYAFGSVLRDDFRPGESDIDLLVEFKSMSPFELVDAYFELLDELREIFESPIDLVMADAIKNPYIIADIDEQKQALYAA